MKSYQFIALNIVAIIFSFFALGVLLCWIFPVDIFFPDKFPGPIITVEGMIIFMPAIIYFIVKFGKPPKVGIISGIIYLSFWIAVLIRLITLFN
jgi:hypothetical protein